MSSMNNRNASLSRNMPNDRRQSFNVMRVHDVGSNSIENLTELYSCISIPRVCNTPAKLIESRSLIAGNKAVIKPPAILWEEPKHVDAAPPFEGVTLVTSTSSHYRHTVTQCSQSRCKHLSHDLSATNNERRIEAVDDQHRKWVRALAH